MNMANPIDFLVVWLISFGLPTATGIITAQVLHRRRNRTR